VYPIALDFQAIAGQLVPKRGYAELRDQLDRASISIVLNIALWASLAGGQGSLLLNGQG